MDTFVLQQTQYVQGCSSKERIHTVHLFLNKDTES